MLRAAVLLPILYAVSAIPLRSTGSNDLKIIMLPDGAKSNGPACLDGSPPAVYFSPASDPKKANTFVIFFEGGGWCYNEIDCLTRSTGSVGTSKGWGPTTSVGGLLSSDCNINPEFCQANRAFLPYCDGNSFSGMRDEPLNVNGTNLYFRGRKNIDAALNELLTNHGLDKADSVLLSGCSAGGLATYLHADYVGDYLKSRVPTLRRYKAAPLSGFFLMHNNVEDAPIYPTEIQNIFQMSNAAAGVNQDCIASKAPQDQWQCNFASETYNHIKSDIFVIDSALDSWQTACILTSEPVVNEAVSHVNGNCSAALGWGGCAGSLGKCSTQQIRVYEGYMSEFLGTMRMSPTYSKAGNGAFVYSCHTHCSGQSDDFAHVSINGVTMQQALSKWWNAEQEPAEVHSHLPCQLSEKLPYQCNPTCPQ